MPRAVAPAQTSGQPFAKGSIIWEKKGPLPVWAWALLLLGLLVVIALWRRNKAEANADEITTGEGDLPGNQSAGPIFIVPQAPVPAIQVAGPTVNVPITVPTAPPGAGRDDTPAPPAPPQPIPSPPGKKVTVDTYTTKNPPWNSTLSGIFGYTKARGGTSSNWQAIWNHPLNADLRAKRGKAENIRKGDQVFVPGFKG